MIWRERNLLLVLLFAGFVLSDKDEVEHEQPKIQRSFFAARLRGQTSPPFQGTGFNQGGFRPSFKRRPAHAVELTDNVEELESALQHEFQDNPPSVQVDAGSRVRPEVELEHSIQGQVAEALIKDSLAGQIRESLSDQSRSSSSILSGHSRSGPPTRPEGHNPSGIRSKLVRPLVPQQSISTEDNTRENELAREPVGAPLRSPAKGRRVIFPPRSKPVETERVRVSQRPESPELRIPLTIKKEVDNEVDAMMKKHSANLRSRTDSPRIIKLEKEVTVARLNTARDQVAANNFARVNSVRQNDRISSFSRSETTNDRISSENERLNAELDELRAKLLEAERSLKSRIEDLPPKEVTERQRLYDLYSLVEKENLSVNPQKTITTKKSKKSKKKSKDKTPVYKPSTFFSNARNINVIPINDPSVQESGRQDPFQRFRSQVKVEDVEVPRFSKMVKNAGLRLLAQDEHAVPAREIAFPSRTNPRTSLAQHGRNRQVAPVTKKPTPGPAVQGFKIKGDTSNRIIFLNIAELGLKFTAGNTLKLGNNDLVPVDGLTGFSDALDAPRGRGKVMNIDAVDKMVSTHLQQNFSSRRPVDLPAYRNPIDAFRGPTSRNTLSRTPSSSRFAATESERERPARRKQPVQFFNKFDDGKQLDRIQVDDNPNERQLPRQSKNLQDRTSSQQRGRSDGFNSFPQRSGLTSLPQRQLNDVTLQSPRNQQSRVPQSQQLNQNRIQFTVQQQSRNEVEAVPLSRQFSRFQQQSQQNQFSQQPQQNQFSQQPQQNQFSQQPQQNQFSQQNQLAQPPRQNQFSQQFTIQQQQYQQPQAPRFEPQQVAPLPPPDVPGIEAHLAETAKIIALQQSQAKKAAVLEAKRLGELAQQQSNRNQQQNRFQQQDSYQQNQFQQQDSYQQQNNFQQNNFQQQPSRFQQQPPRFQTQPQNEPQPQVPGLAEHQRQLQEHAALVQQSQPQQQQQQPQQVTQPQYNPVQQQQQTHEQSQQQVLASHQQGLEQHSRYVAELQAAQNALNG